MCHIYSKLTTKAGKLKSKTNEHEQNKNKQMQPIKFTVSVKYCYPGTLC